MDRKVVRAMTGVSIALLAAGAWADPIAGDINRDRSVDALDVQLVVNGALGLDIGARNANVDGSADGAADAIDVQLIINAVLGIDIDADNDGLSDAAEAKLGTSSIKRDSDDDGVCDGLEFLYGTDPVVADSEVHFADPDLEAAVRAWFTGHGTPLGATIHAADLAGVGFTDLDAPGSKASDISDLGGLQYATDLEHLDLHGNSISNLSPLAFLSNLHSLGLWDNAAIADLVPLADLRDLEWLGLDSNQISDVGPLSGLTNLSELFLEHNQIADISPLVGNAGLGSGDYVHLYYNSLSQDALCNDIPALEARGVTVLHDGECGAASPVNLLFVHHSVGQNWLDHSLNAALLAKDYVDEQNDVYYNTVVAPDAGRPDSLGPGVLGGEQGDHTDINDWVRWFNDYLDTLKTFGCDTGSNTIIMFKSCFVFNSIINSDGVEPGNPFVVVKTLANYKAVFRHPDGPGNTYSFGGYTYKAIEDIFAENPDTLFIFATIPPQTFGPPDGTDNVRAHRQRVYANWLKNDWLPAYQTRTGLNNAAVFDLFDLLAYPDDDPLHPNRLRAAYGGDTEDPHPNATANAQATLVFATGPTNFLDQAWAAFNGSRKR